MNRNDFIARRISAPLEWFRIYCLYRRSFPRSERKPFRIIVSMWKKGKTDVWYLAEGRRFAGFATTINGEARILLDYLAVREKMRGRGAGSRMLEELKKQYAGKGIFVEIESAFENGKDQLERVRRRKFYLKNGMESARVMASVFGVKMELLCWNCRVNFAEYRAFYRDNYSPWAAEHIVEADYPHN